MLAAELGGKLPSETRCLEDVLTSYVFCFLRYSDRRFYLRSFLEDAVGIDVTAEDVEGAEFQFWPTLPDGTQPDVVIVVGGHYLLFEAKLYSPVDGSQLARESEQGAQEAERRGLAFRLVVVTAHSCKPRQQAQGLSCVQSSTCWMNWQRVTRMILGLMEEHGEKLPAREYAEDLLAILEARRLRGYRGFAEIPLPGTTLPRGRLFLQVETMDYRGDFLGFPAALMRVATLGPPPATVFFSRGSFSGFEHRRTLTPPRGRIFFERG